MLNSGTLLSVEELQISECIRSLPQTLEAPTSDARVVHRMARVAMAEVILHRAQVRASVGEIVAARVTQCVRVHGMQPSLHGRRRHEIEHGASGERLPALGNEKPWQPIPACPNSV
jgi:hypothetical protein